MEPLRSESYSLYSDTAAIFLVVGLVLFIYFEFEDKIKGLVKFRPKPRYVARREGYWIRYIRATKLAALNQASQPLLAAAGAEVSGGSEGLAAAAADTLPETPLGAVDSGEVQRVVEEVLSGANMAPGDGLVAAQEGDQTAVQGEAKGTSQEGAAERVKVVKRRVRTTTKSSSTTTKSTSKTTKPSTKSSTKTTKSSSTTTRSTSKTTKSKDKQPTKGGGSARVKAAAKTEGATKRVKRVRGDAKGEGGNS